MLSPYDRPGASSLVPGDQYARSVHSYIQCADSSPVGITRLPEAFQIPTLLYDYGHQGGLSTGHPVVYNAPPSYPPRMEQPHSDAEWMAALERIPIHNPAGNTSTGQPLETRGFPQTVVMANETPLWISPTEQPFHVVNTPLLPPRIHDPRFIGQVENTATSFMSVSQNDTDLGDLIASMDGSLSTETPESYQYSDTLLGTLFHSCGYSVS